MRNSTFTLVIALLLVPLLVPRAAQAQKTPASYCASLAANTCEVLNVSIIPSPQNQNLMFVHVKYCKNQKFKSLYGKSEALLSYGGSMTVYSQGNGRISNMESSASPTWVYSDFNDCTTLP